MDIPAGRLEERTVESEIAGYRGLSGKLGAEVSVPEGIEIELIHAERKISRIVIAQLDVSAHEQ